MTEPLRGSASYRSHQQLRGKAFTRVLRDVYVLEGREISLRTRVEAARRIFPDGIPCTTTAAQLQHLPVRGDGVTHLARGLTAPRSERATIRVHRLAVLPDETFELSGMSVTTGPRTFTDLAATHSLEALVAVGDVVVRRWGSEAVGEAVARTRRRPGAVLLRRALPLLDAGADSPAETRARLRLHAAGFSALRHGVVVRDLGGGWLGQPDLADDVAKVALQHEGAVHFAKGERQRRRDLDRDEVVRQEDWQVVTSTALDDARPERLIAKVTSAYLRSAKVWGRQVLPPHLR